MVLEIPWHLEASRLAGHHSPLFFMHQDLIAQANVIGAHAAAETWDCRHVGGKRI